MKFACKNCGQHLDANDGLAGHEVLCPACNLQVIVPGLELPEPASGAYVYCRCNHCPGEIHCSAKSIGQEIECPHCGLFTVIYPHSEKQLVKDNTEAGDEMPYSDSATGVPDQNEDEPPLTLRQRLVVFAIILVFAGGTGLVVGAACGALLGGFVAWAAGFLFSGEILNTSVSALDAVGNAHLRGFKSIPGGLYFGAMGGGSLGVLFGFAAALYSLVPQSAKEERTIFQSAPAHKKKAGAPATKTWLIVGGSVAVFAAISLLIWQQAIFPWRIVKDRGQSARSGAEMDPEDAHPFHLEPAGEKHSGSSHDMEFSYSPVLNAVLFPLPGIATQHSDNTGSYTFGSATFKTRRLVGSLKGELQFTMNLGKGSGAPGRVSAAGAVADYELGFAGMRDFSDNFRTIRFSVLHQYDRKNKLVRSLLNGSLNNRTIQAEQVALPFGKGQIKFYGYEFSGGKGTFERGEIYLDGKVDLVFRGREDSPGHMILTEVMTPDAARSVSDEDSPIHAPYDRNELQQLPSDSTSSRQRLMEKYGFAP